VLSRLKLQVQCKFEKELSILSCFEILDDLTFGFCALNVYYESDSLCNSHGLSFSHR